MFSTIFQKLKFQKIYSFDSINLISSIPFGDFFNLTLENMLYFEGLVDF